MTMVSVGQYLASFAYDLIFFSCDVQTTTIAMAITGSLCCSIMWAIVHLVTLVQDTQAKDCSKGGNRCSPKVTPCSQYTLVTSKSIFVNKQPDNTQHRLFIQSSNKQCHLCHGCCHGNHNNSEQHHKSASDLTKDQWACRHLDLRHHQLRELPQRLCFLGTQLTDLDLSYNSIASLPSDVVCLQGLTSLQLGSNQLTTIPVTLGTLHNLLCLDLQKNRLSHIPDFLWTLPKLKYLNVEGNNLKEISHKIKQLGSLEELFLGFNQISVLPETIGCLLNLRILSLMDNRVNRLPDSIGHLLSLQEFNLAFCQLESLPVTIGGCVSLVTLNLSNNKLRQLPFEMSELSKLEELYLSDNNSITYLPATMEYMKLNLLEGTSVSMSDITNLPCLKVGQSFPSLVELSCQTLIIHRVTNTDLLPSSLQEVLKKRQFCSRCRCPVFNVFHSRVRRGFIGCYSQVVPLLEILCFKHFPSFAEQLHEDKTKRGGGGVFEFIL